MYSPPHDRRLKELMCEGFAGPGRRGVCDGLGSWGGFLGVYIIIIHRHMGEFERSCWSGTVGKGLASQEKR